MCLWRVALDLSQVQKVYCHLEELTFQYKVYFKKGFNFVISGKLPGIYLGTFQEGYSTGKDYNDGQGSFRPTWQARGRKRTIVSPYLYGAHGDYNSALRAQGPKTAALLEGSGRAGMHFWMKGNSTLPLKSGWNKIELALKLNTPGKPDGKARVTINGQESSPRGYDNLTVFGGQDDLDSIASSFDNFEVNVVDPVKQGEGVSAYISSGWLAQCIWIHMDLVSGK
eukprot:jgi/Picre1/30365/NNA_005729.t1